MPEGSGVPSNSEWPFLPPITARLSNVSSQWDIGRSHPGGQDQRTCLDVTNQMESTVTTMSQGGRRVVEECSKIIVPSAPMRRYFLGLRHRKQKLHSSPHCFYWSSVITGHIQRGLIGSETFINVHQLQLTVGPEADQRSVLLTRNSSTWIWFSAPRAGLRSATCNRYKPSHLVSCLYFKLLFYFCFVFVMQVYV